MEIKKFGFDEILGCQIYSKVNTVEFFRQKKQVFCEQGLAKFSHWVTIRRPKGWTGPSGLVGDGDGNREGSSDADLALEADIAVEQVEVAPHDV